MDRICCGLAHHRVLHTSGGHDHPHAGYTRHFARHVRHLHDRRRVLARVWHRHRIDADDPREHRDSCPGGHDPRTQAALRLRLLRYLTWYRTIISPGSRSRLAKAVKALSPRIRALHSKSCPLRGVSQRHMPPVDISLDMRAISGINQTHIQYKSVKTDHVWGVAGLHLKTVDRAVFQIDLETTALGGNAMSRSDRSSFLLRHAITLAISGASLALPMQAIADAADAATDADELEEVVVTGFRGSLNTALGQKREATAAIDSIVAEDIG